MSKHNGGVYKSSVLTVSEDDVVKVKNATELNFEGGVTVVDEGCGKVTITVSGDTPDDDCVGDLWQADFGNDGTSSNLWLNNNQYGIRSNQTSVPAVWKSKLVGISFSNRYAGVDQDFKIYASSEGDGHSPKTKIFEWQIRNCRVARKTNFSPDVIIEAGDKFGIFMSDQGKNPNDPRVTTYWKVIDCGPEGGEEACEVFSGDFDLGSGGGTTTT